MNQGPLVAIVRIVADEPKAAVTTIVSVTLLVSFLANVLTECIVIIATIVAVVLNIGFVL